MRNALRHAVTSGGEAHGPMVRALSGFAVGKRPRRHLRSCGAPVASGGSEPKASVAFCQFEACREGNPEETMPL